MKKFAYALIMFIIVSALTTTLSLADTLVFKNGDKLTGTLVGFSAQTCVYVSEHSQNPIEVPWSQVRTMKTDKSYSLEMVGGEKVVGKLNYSDKSGLNVLSSTMPKATVDLNKLEKISLTEAAGATPTQPPAVVEASSKQKVKKTSAEKENKVATAEKTEASSEAAATYGSEDESPPLNFLRGSSVLLNPGQVEGRVVFGYAPSKTENYGTYQRRLFTTNFGLNVGIHERLEGWVYVPFGFARGHSNSVFHFGQPPRENKFELMDVALGFNTLLRHETADWPEITLSVSGTIPTGDSPYRYEHMNKLGSGHWSATGGVNFVKSVDPAVIFFGASASYLWPAEEYGDRFSYGKDLSWDYYFGTGFAVNDRLSLSGRFLGGYRPALKYNGNRDGNFSSDPMWLNAGFGYRITDNMVLEPQVMFGVGNEANDSRISVGLSRKFN